MARSEFGGTFAAWIVTTGTAAGDGSLPVVLPSSPVTLTIYDNPDGAVVTDLLDEGGAPVTSISVAAGSAYIPRFSGPDGLTSLWVQEAGGRWLPIPRWDPGTDPGGGSGDVVLAGDNSYEYPDSQQPPWLQIDVPDDGSLSSGWSNRLEVRFWDNTTSQYRHGFHVNEKGLLRARGTTPNDVPARFMAHPAQTLATAILELTPSDNAIKLAQFFLDRAVFTIGVTLPYVTNPGGERLYFGSADPNTDAAYADHRPRVGDGWVDYNGEA